MRMKLSTYIKKVEKEVNSRDINRDNHLCIISRQISKTPQLKEKQLEFQKLINSVLKGNGELSCCLFPLEWPNEYIKITNIFRSYLLKRWYKEQKLLGN